MGTEHSTARKVARFCRALLFPAVVAAVFFGVLPRIANMDQVWASIRSLTWQQTLILLFLTALNIVTYWPMLVAAMPGLTLGQAAVVCQTSTSVAMTLPVGGAIAVGVSYGMYTSWGFTTAEVARSAMATFFANMTFKLILPASALLLLVLEGDASGGMLATALLGLAVFAACVVVLIVLFRDEQVTRWAGRTAGRIASRARRSFGRGPVHGWEETAIRFRGMSVSLLRERGAPLALAEVVSQLAVFSVMLSSIRFVGIPNSQVTIAEALAVFAFVRLASAMPIIPGNVGLAELGYIGGIHLAGAALTPATAAVLLFRFLTYFLQIPLGGLTYLVWRRKTGWRAGVRVAATPPAYQQDAVQAAR